MNRRVTFIYCLLMILMIFGCLLLVFNRHSTMLNFKSSVFTVTQLAKSNETELEVDVKNVVELEKLDGLSGKDLELLYESVAAKAEISCPKTVRLGNAAEGGWNMCLIGNLIPKEPCLVYSFGIRNDWSFDDHVVKMFNCTVRAFDPSMDVSNQKRGSNIFFYKEAVAGSDKIFGDKLWRLNKLSTLRNLLDEADTPIDYMKIDIEYWEWETLETAIKENTLSTVKQLGLEIHRDELFFKTTSVEHYKKFLTILNQLRKIGFYKWSVHLNPQSLAAVSNYTGTKVLCCHEFIFINVNYID